MKKNSARKLLVFVLTIAMVLSLASVSAFAAFDEVQFKVTEAVAANSATYIHNPFPSAIDNLNNNQDIYFAGDPGDITLTFGGEAVTASPAIGVTIKSGTWAPSPVGTISENTITLSNVPDFGQLTFTLDTNTINVFFAKVAQYNLYVTGNGAVTSVYGRCNNPGRVEGGPCFTATASTPAKGILDIAGRGGNQKDASTGDELVLTFKPDAGQTLLSVFVGTDNITNSLTAASDGAYTYTLTTSVSMIYNVTANFSTPVLPPVTPVTPGDTTDDTADDADDTTDDTDTDDADDTSVAPEPIPEAGVASTSELANGLTAGVLDVGGNAAFPAFILTDETFDALIDLNGGTDALIKVPVDAGSVNPKTIVLVRIGDDGSKSIIPFASYEDGYLTALLQDGGTYSVEYNVVAFDDVSGWAKDAIDFVAALELFKGEDDGIFNPEGTMTRAMFVTVLARLSSEALSGFEDTGFGDVAPDQWFAAYIGWAEANGIIAADDAFGPNDPISREDMAVMMDKFIGYMGFSLPEKDAEGFDDLADLNDTSVDSINRIQGAGIINGYDGGYHPENSATRAEVAQIFTNLILALTK